MQLREIMTPNVDMIPPEAMVAEAARKMRDLDVGALPVCDGRRLCGMITDRDIAVRAVAGGRDPRSTTVRDTMTAEVAYGFADDDYEQAVALMKEKQVRRIPVVDRDKRLVGILSLGDVAVRGDDDGLSAETVERVSTPGKR